MIRVRRLALDLGFTWIPDDSGPTYRIASKAFNLVGHVYVGNVYPYVKARWCVYWRPTDWTKPRPRTPDGRDESTNEEIEPDLAALIILGGLS